MREQLKEIIIDFQEVTFETGLIRHMDITPIHRKATVCIGVRRCGKSTLMHQIIARLLSEGVSIENILYINFFDERLHALHEGELNIIFEAYYSLYPHKKNSEKVYCFFDEIQTISGWSLFVERIMRTEKCEVYLTGSSAKLLSKEIATEMRGRALSWEIFPFSFAEYLDYKKLSYQEPFTSKARFLIQNAFDEYCEVGAFPEVIEHQKQLRIKILQEYFNGVLFKDLIERHDIKHPKAVIDLGRWLIDNNGALFSINRLTGYLSSLGHKVPKATISEYISWFEDAYFFFSVQLFDSSLARVNANPKKIYCIDNAMVNAVSSGVMINSGRLLENMIFIALRRLTPNICYYKTASNKEVDFIMPTTNRSRALIQVCETLTDSKTKKREISALQEAMRELKLKKGTIVTRYEQETIETDEGKIKVLPAWQFLLELNQKMRE